MYCTVTELKTYLSISGSGDDNLLASIIAAAQSRIDSFTKRTFEATADTTRYYDAIEDVDGRSLYVDDISYISAVTSAGQSVPASEYVTWPRNDTPYQELRIRPTSTYLWQYVTDPADAITVAGRYAVMTSFDISAIARSTNSVTATIAETSGLFVGQTVHCVGVADSTFNGTFTLTAVTSTSATWAQTASNDTDTTGYLLIVPPAIRQACIRLAAWLYVQRNTQQPGTDSPILVGDGTVIMPAQLPADVTGLLWDWVKKL